MTTPRFPSHFRHLTAILLAASCTAFAATRAYCQAPCIPESADHPINSIVAAPTYDVASIRQLSSIVSASTFRDMPHEAKLAMSGISMKNLIENAYGVSSYQVFGGPSWIESEHFDVQARSDTSLNGQLAKLSDCDAGHEKRLMLQALLADRLKLVVHRSTREVSGYDLVVAKGGSRLPQSNPPSPPPGDNAEPANYSMSMNFTKLGYELSAPNYPLSFFASWLANGELYCPVSDKTGLTAEYDIKLQWSNEDSAASGASKDILWPFIFTAIQEQLGLKLLPSKVPVETILIDHIEHPSGN